MKQFFIGSILLAALAANANAGAVGVCLVSAAYETGGDTTAEYASADVSAGCTPGFFPSVILGGTVSPTSLGPGLTTATLTTTQVNPSGVTAIATSTASLDMGILREFSVGQGYAESLLGDNVHFAITDKAPTAIVTLNAHLDGSVTGSASGSFSILDEFNLGGNGCWESVTGPGFGPCAVGNNSFISSSFTNQTATGFDFTGTFQVTNGATDPFSVSLQLNCYPGETCDFSNTGKFRSLCLRTLRLRRIPVSCLLRHPRLPSPPPLVWRGWLFSGREFGEGGVDSPR